MKLKYQKPTYNAAKCVLCGHILESRHRHDYRTHGCNGPDAPKPKTWQEREAAKVCFMVDGGLDYVRRGVKSGTKPEDNYIELSTYEEIELEY